MAEKELKIDELSEDIQVFIEKVLREDNPYLLSIGLTFKYYSIKKQPTVIKITKPTLIVEYLTDGKVELIITVYEEAFKRLSEEFKRLIVLNALDSIEYDAEKDKVNILNGYGTQLSEGVYMKYKEPAALAIFAAAHAVRDIDEDAKLEKANKKANGR